MAVSKFKVTTVSEIELFYWFRDRISPNLLGLNELSNGVDLCVGVDMLFPGVIGSHVIEVTETGEYFKRLNFKRLQDAFLKLNVAADIPVDGLIKKSFKDILNFGIWFKAFFEANSKSKPGNLNEVREVHLKKLVKKKRPHECRKIKFHAKDVKNPTSFPKDMDFGSIRTYLKMSIVRNTDLRELGSDIQNDTLNPAEEIISVGSNQQKTQTKNMTFGNSEYMRSKSVSKELKQSNALKPNYTSQINTSNTKKKITGNSDGDQKIDSDQSIMESNGNTDLLIIPETDGTFGLDLTTPPLNVQSPGMMIAPVIL